MKLTERKTILVIVAVVLLLGAGWAVWNLWLKPEPVACTLEAKLCPDGSAVGRTGPNCEFATCPGEER
ncbi:MAG: hypothetical protein Q8L46_00740 [candidate division WWE3 bacterium]|nr:hypothetical protein [candidate division WWE3 bacterium]